jgi:NADPH2:quinone reductase
MLAVRFYQHGGPEVLKCEEVPTPHPGADEVLIRIEAAGVNYADTVRRNGDYYPVPTVFPAIPGGEIAGSIESLGEGVEHLQVGAHIFALIDQGGYAQYAVAPTNSIIPVPEGLDPVQGIALIVQGLTAALVLKETVGLRAGESILIQGAAGGVGLLSIQLAKIYGAGLVIAVAGSPEKREFALSLGADCAIDYTLPDWPQQVLKATDGHGVDIVQEMTGGHVFQQSLDCLAKFGRLVVYGFASREPVNLDPGRLLPFNHTVKGFYLGGFLHDKQELVNATLAELAGFVASGLLKLHMGGAFPLTKAAEAHRLLEGRQTRGKLVILPWDTV